MKYCKKPVEIEAVRLDNSLSDDDFANFMGKDEFKYDVYGINIHTLEGIMRANPGDWIIRGIKGELYPCKNDIFEAIYELCD